MAHIRTHDTERRKNKVVKSYGVVWREPDRDQFGLPIPVNPDHRGAEAMRAWRETYSARRATRQGSAPWPSRRGGELPFGYDARGWLDAQAVKVSQVKLMQRTVKPPPWPRQTTDGPTGLTRFRSPGL